VIISTYDLNLVPYPGVERLDDGGFRDDLDYGNFTRANVFEGALRGEFLFQ